MEINLILNHVLVIYLMIAIGFYANKVKIIDAHTNLYLSKFLLNIALPFYIITAFKFSYSKEVIKNIGIILIFGIILHPLIYLIGVIIYRKHTSRSVLIFSLIFSNCGYMAFPILNSLYGNIGVIYGSIFLAPFNIYLWTVGISLFSKKESSKSKVMNPGVVAVIIGVILFSFSIKLPYSIDKTIETVGSMTTPLSMIIIGGIISEVKIKEMFGSKSIYYNSIIRLIVIPILILVILKTLPLDKDVLGICVLLSAMPVAVTLPIFANRFNEDIILASKSVFISTILSIITIPIIVLILSFI